MPYPFQHQHKPYQLKAAMIRLREAIYVPLAQLQVEAFLTAEPLPFERRTEGRRVTLGPGDSWGKLWDCGWFHFTGAIPREAAGQPVSLLIDVNGEACVFDAQGTPVRGLTCVRSHFDSTLGMPGKRVLDLTRRAQGGEPIDVWADCGCNDLFGSYQDDGRLREAHVALYHPDREALYYDFEVLIDLMEQLPARSPRRQRLLYALAQAEQCLLDFSGPSVEAARAALAPELSRCSGDESLAISAVGHAHIDLAWLWPLRETYRKGARTFSTVLRNMERFPDYVYGQSQPQIYQWMKDQHPALYAQIKQRVAEGRWELQGALWVECDTNVPSGESLVRQLLYGQRFWQREFGKRSNMVWLPDTFGYSGVLPQLIRKAGLKYFMTQKLSWDRINDYPHHSFFWQGIDGSKVLVHLPPEDTYNSSAAPRAVARTVNEYLDASVSDHCLLVFGIGDGGGGPGVEHLERLARQKDLLGLVPVRQEPAEAFFARLEGEAERFPTWAGELYLAAHQGTLTTQARNKRWNRVMELALRRLELVASLAGLLGGAPYPAGRIEAIWKEVLLYQFHDILPGSSIQRVYDESLARYDALHQEVLELTRQTQDVLARCIDTQDMNRPVLVQNDLSWEREAWIEHDGRWLRVRVPAMGYAAADLAAPQAPVPAIAASEQALENDLLRVGFDGQGWIRSVWDKALNREMLAGEAPANALTVYDDQGDAWDFPIDTDQRVLGRFELTAQSAHVDGPRAILHQERAFGASRLIQEVVLEAGRRDIQFVTTVDWRESKKMLRVAFPVAVQASQATFEIQFGALKRSTHNNTGWEQGQFEVPAQRWVDLSQGDCGVALLNDCKYGHKVKGNVLDLDLLRSPEYPGVEADRAEHRLTYALYPHAGDHVSGGVMRAAAELNVPLRAISELNGAAKEAPASARKGLLPPSGSFLAVDSPDVVIDTVKRAEDGEGLVVRLYEANGRGARARLKVNLPLGRASLVNLVEEPLAPLEMKDGQLELVFGPFEIHTVRLEV